jgi:hypothetical protein
MAAFENVTVSLVLLRTFCLALAMPFAPLKKSAPLAMFAIIASLFASASPASKPHVITFGKWSTVPWFTGTGSTDEKPLTIKVRPILVDGRVKENSMGPPHEVTDRLFVIRRAFRFNDSLPQESSTVPRWQWQPGGWLLVDRLTGHISPLNLPEFDPIYSAASWYRDYAAYCGVSDDGKKVYAMVAQIGRRKPALKKPMEGLSIAVVDDAKSGATGPVCPAPSWERAPARVAFEPTGAARQNYVIRGHVVDLTGPDDEEEAAN